MKYPFEADPKEVLSNPDAFVEAVFSSLESEFLILPKGDAFVEYAAFEGAYEALKKVTSGFSQLPRQKISDLVYTTPLCLLVIRSILGFTPPEWAYVASQRKGEDVDQNFARDLERRARVEPLRPMKHTPLRDVRLKAMIEAACDLIEEGPPKPNPVTIHRLDKADTAGGLETIKSLAALGAPYAMVLYERFLGRPFAGHRDSVSGLVGDTLESAIEDVLTKAGITYRKTKRAEKLPGFEQAPDFVIPDEFAPKVVVEAKIAEDDGTARDKVTRIWRLGAMSTADMPPGQQKYQVIACIAGRGFKVRAEDMKTMLIATRGKVFTLKTLPRLVECSKLKEFATKTA
jgi:hypothetical protein